MASRPKLGEWIRLVFQQWPEHTLRRVSPKCRAIDFASWSVVGS